jgi:O-antigen ligase
MYTDPNYGAISTTVGLMFSIHFFRIIRRQLARVLLAFTGIVFVVHIIFSASRGGYIALFVAIAVYTITSVFLFRGSKDKKRVIIRLIYAAGIVVGLLLLLVLFAFLTRSVFLKIIQSQAAGSRGWIWHYKQKLEQAGLRDLLPHGTDLSNGRIRIWKSSVDFFKAAPLFGIDFRNIRLAAPETVLKSFGVGAGQLRFDAFHNLFIDILVSQGALGFLIFMVFTFFCLLSLARLYSRLKAESSDVKMLFALLVSILAACLASSMFLSDILYVNTQNSVIFWISLGYATRLAYIYTKKDDKLE